MASIFFTLLSFLLLTTSINITASETKAKPAPQQQQPQVQYVYMPYDPATQTPPPAPMVLQTHTQGNVQYVYMLYNPATQTPPAGSYVMQQQQQAQTPATPQAQHTSSGPQVGEVMTTFAGVLSGIVALGMGSDANDPAQQAAGLNMFINSGAQLITALTRKPCSPEQFTRAFMQIAESITRSKRQNQ